MFNYLPKRLKRANRHVPLLAAALLVAPAAWAQVTIPGGNPVGTTDRKPYGNYFGFERSAAIYTAADLGATGSITTVGFYLESIAAPVAAVPAKIYLKTTTSTSFAAAATVAAEETGATLVYDATIPASAFTAGTWVTVTLTTPFAVTAADNLEVIVEANGGGGGTEGLAAKVFRFNAAGANRFQSWQADNAAPTTAGTLAAARPNIQFAGLTPVACAAPSGLTVAAGSTIANVTFAAGNGNTGYTLTYTPTGGTAVTQTATTSPVALTGLMPGTTYAVRLVGNCAGGATSAAATGSFTTTLLSNDNPIGAIDLPIATTCTPVSGTNVGATTTAAAGLGYTNPGCGIANSPLDVWYKFTTAATGAASTGALITVTGAPAGQVRVFSSTGGAAGPFTQVGCAASTASNTVAPALTLRGLMPSTTYYVFVSGYGSGDTTGPFTICATTVVSNDAAVAVIQTLGTVSSTYGSPVTVRAVIRNNGLTAQTALPVTLTVAGATTFTDVQTVASLAGGASTTVTFTAYPVTTAGVNTLTVSVPADDNLTNNSQSYSQTVTAGTQGYIDTTQPFASGTVGVGAVNGVLVARYSSSSAAAVTTITPTFQGAGTAGTTYQLLVYGSNAGVPGTLLYTSPTLTRPTTTGPVATAVPSIPVSGDFFVGIRELSGNVALAYQLEDPLRAGAFFFTVTNGTTWTDVNTTALRTRLALDVTLAAPAACGAAVSLAVTNVTTTTASVGFTAPASGTSYTVTYTPTNGTATTVTPAPTASPVALSGLLPGTTYTVSVTTNCAAGTTSGAVTTTFTTPAPAPANDLCSAATVLTCGQTVTGTTVGATTTGDPATTAVCTAGSPLAPSASPGVFYSFAGNGQLVTVSTCSGPSATAGDTKVFVYSGSCGTLTCVGSNDDAVAGGCGTNSRASTVIFPTVSGTTYYVFVQYFSAGATGPFGLSLTCAPPVVTTYATLPVSESFEGPWVNGLGTRDLPSASWRNTPATGNASWRRDDDGASAAWTFTTLGGYTPVSSQGARSARFHSALSPAGSIGSLDLYVNLSGGSGNRTLTFDYVNPTSSATNPADQLDVLVSTDGGTTFSPTPLLTATTSATFTGRTVIIPSTSATTVIRFRALADFGDDIGIDNVRVSILTATRNAALAATVSLYPNPAHRAFTLDVPAGTLRAATATLHNALGQAVQTRQLSAGGSTTFDVSGLAAGVYSLELEAGDMLVVKRVVVE